MFYAFSVWVKIDNIKPYLPYKTYIMKGNKTKQFQLACKEIEIYIKEIGVNDLVSYNIFIIIFLFIILYDFRLIIMKHLKLSYKAY